MALAIGRRVREGIMIGEHIHIMVASINREQVKLAITAPRNLTILRDELVPACTDGCLLGEFKRKENDNAEGNKSPQVVRKTEKGRKVNGVSSKDSSSRNRQVAGNRKKTKKKGVIGQNFNPLPL